MLVVWRLRYSLWRRVKAWLKGRSEGKRGLPATLNKLQPPTDPTARRCRRFDL